MSLKLHIMIGIKVIGRLSLLLYIVCQVFTRLGYTFGLKKCVFQPVQCLKHLGFIVDSIKQAIVLPKDKIKRFSESREYLVFCWELEVRSLQRFAGKCISFSLAISAAKLYTIEVKRSISWCLKYSKTVMNIGDSLTHGKVLYLEERRGIFSYPSLLTPQSLSGVQWSG